jgi:Tfp pilus assembly protein PilF
MPRSPITPSRSGSIRTTSKATITAPTFCQDKGDLDAALQEYDRATKIDPTYAAAYYSRGQIYEKKGDLDKARAEYNAALAVPTINRIAQWAQDNARARLKALADGAKQEPAK